MAADNKGTPEDIVGTPELTERIGRDSALTDDSDISTKRKEAAESMDGA